MSKSATSRRTKCIGITMGDPRGIGPEVILKALRRPEIARLAAFIIVGDRKLVKGVKSAVIDVPYRSAAEGSLKFLNKGIDLIKGGIADALVTAPLSKEEVNKYHKGFIGHTEHLAQAFDVKNFDMMFVSSELRMSLVTRHVPLKDIPPLITKKAVLSSIELMHQTLKDQFRIKSPRIAVWGLNPHAGEGGLLGMEEIKAIIPAIQEAVKKGIKANGPYPADTFFCHDKACDGIVAMYHDQGLTPVKGMYFKDLVNFTAGLPFVRTSPVHGTAWDIAGKNIADPSSMMASIKLAAQLA